ncbi:MAG: sensor histidine kinase, partial [SAR324 cluster bacterium]|nr:sensor histidine kinase [SAR324 cluster bacterium]
MFLLFLGALLIGSIEASTFTEKTIAVSPGRSYDLLLEGARYWIDETSEATLNDVLHAKDLDWRRSQRFYVNFGPHSGAVWVKASLSNKSKEKTSWILHATIPIVDSRVYIIEEDQTLVQEVPPHPRAFRGELTEISLNPGQRIVLYVRSHSESTHIVRYELVGSATFWRDKDISAIPLNMYYGAVIIMVLYNMWLFVSLKDKSYLYYSLSVLAMGFFQAAAVDHNLSKLLVAYGSVTRLAYFSAVPVGLFYTLFIQHLFNTQKICPRWHKALQVNLYYAALLLVAVPFLPVRSLQWVVGFWGFVVAFVNIGAGILAYQVKHPAVKLYFAGLLVYTVGVMLFSNVIQNFPLFGLDPWQVFWVIKGTTLFDILVLGLALGSRYNAYRQETIESQAKLIKFSEEHAKNLEAKVLERTQELRNANDVKNKFFSIISHDLRGPIGYMSMLLNDMVKKASEINDKTFASLQETSLTTYNLLEQLLVWSRSQKGEIEFNPQNISIATEIQANLDLYRSNAHQKNIRLQANLDQNLFAHADAGMVSTVIRNLINNAIKYTPAEGQITVSSLLRGNQIKVMVEDTGLGMSDKTYLAKIMGQTVIPRHWTYQSIRCKKRFV